MENSGKQKKFFSRRVKILLAISLLLVSVYYYLLRTNPWFRGMSFRVFCAFKLDRAMAPFKFIAIHDPESVLIRKTHPENDSLPVLGVVVDGEAKAYTLREAIWHHIIHDTVGKRRLLITYCNLTFTPIVYDIGPAGKSVDSSRSFTVYGLYENNMIMKETRTEKLWLQATGMPLDSENTGKPPDSEKSEKLPRIQSYLTTLGEWAMQWPDSKVFMGEKRCKHHKTLYPHHQEYCEYFQTDVVALALSNPDKKGLLHPKEFVTGIFVGGKSYCLVNKDFPKSSATRIQCSGKELVVFTHSAFDSLSVYESQGMDFVEKEGTYYDQKTGKAWNLFGHPVKEKLAMVEEGEFLKPVDSLTSFWFSWHNFTGGEVVRKP